MDTIVPFGKYKGKEVSHMLKDAQYVKWCGENNILERYPKIFNIVYSISVDNKDQPTPEHNQMQHEWLTKERIVQLVEILYKRGFQKITEIIKEKGFHESYGHHSIKFSEHIKKSLIRIVPEDKFNWDISAYLESCTLSFHHLNKDKAEKLLLYKAKWLEDLNNLLLDLEKECLDAEEHTNKLYESLKKERCCIIAQHHKIIQTCGTVLSLYKKHNWDIDLNSYSKRVSVCNDLTKQTVIPETCRSTICNYQEQLKHYKKELTIGSIVHIAECAENLEQKIISRVYDSIITKTYLNWESIVPQPPSPEVDWSRFTRQEKYKSNKYMNDGYCYKSFKDYKKRVLENFDKHFEKDFEDVYYKDFPKVERITLFENTRILCELKPIIGEEYPSILRKMREQIERTKLDAEQGKGWPSRHSHFLIGKSLDLETSSKSQVCTFFAAHNIRFVMMDDIDNGHDINNKQRLTEPNIIDSKGQKENDILDYVKRLEKENILLKHLLEKQGVDISNIVE